MATIDYMTSQEYSATIGGVVYNVTVGLGGAGRVSAIAATADDTTPSVAGATHLLIPANTVATAITQLDGASAGHQVTILMTSATNPSTIANAGNFTMSAAWSPGAGDTITLFTANGTAWYEVCRSNN